jgi:beta-N-acetylhexosaminidase
VRLPTACDDRHDPERTRGRRPASSPVPGRRRAAAVAAVGLLVGLAGCGNGGSGTPAASAESSSATTSSAAPTTTTTSPGATPSPSASGTTRKPPPPATSTKPVPASCVDRAISGMSRAQQVGQLFMSEVGSTRMSTSQAAAITQGKVGSVFLMGHTSAGTAAVRKVTDQVRKLAPSVRGADVGMLVATDQEGGQVQVLGGPGFSQMPSAADQGKWSDAKLRAEATTWGRQLRSAGVTMNLAPVADTVPPDLVNVNEPIGKLDRNFGTDPATVAGHSDAFLRGMRQAGVVPSIKHFPGLGRVTGNTDLTANVKDNVTTTTDPFLQPFRSGIQAGTPFVMVGSAIYPRIDAKNQADFSPAVMRTLLRGRLGFKGAIISDDIGAAVAVSDRSPAQRALDFIGAGGNVVLTVRPADIVPMTSAVISRMATDSALRSSVDDSVRRVLTAKRNAGLLTC